MENNTNQEDILKSQIFFICENCKEVPQIELKQDLNVYLSFCKCKEPKSFPLKEFISQLKPITNELSLNNKCEVCSNNIFNYYCKSCHFGICESCMKDHTKEHIILDLNEFFKEDFLISLNDRFESTSNLMKSELLKYKLYVENFEKALNNCKDYIKTKEEENNQIVEFFKSLMNAYNSTKNTPNYNIRNNLFVNDIKKLYNLKLNIFADKFKDEIKNSLPFMVVSDIIKDGFYLEGEYLLKEKEEYDDEEEYENSLKIFGKDFNSLNDSNCKMLIDGKEVKFRKSFLENKIEAYDYDFSSFSEKFQLKAKEMKKSKNLTANDTIKKGIHKVKITMNPGCSIDNMYHMFAFCTSLSKINLMNFDTSNIIDISSLFSHCKQLQSINLMNFNSSKITNMDDIFSNCSSLKELNLSSFNTNRVNSMQGTFRSCNNLENLNLSSFNTSNVKNMNKMFASCNKLSSINLTNFDTAKVKDMTGLFDYCSNLNELDLSSFNTSNVTTMNGMFNNCINLQKIIFNFNTPNVWNMCGMFKNCQNLKELICNFDLTNAINLGYMFSNCENLINISLNNKLASKLVNLEYMFNSCKNLSSLNLSQLDTSYANNMNHIFDGCEKLKTLDLSNFKTSNVSNMDGIFKECHCLSEIIYNEENCKELVDDVKKCIEETKKE